MTARKIDEKIRKARRKRRRLLSTTASKCGLLV